MIAKENTLTEAIRRCASELSSKAIWVTESMDSFDNIDIIINLKKMENDEWQIEMRAEKK